MKNLPIGIQSFKEIRGKNYLYVDKTAYVYALMEKGKYFFLSRPRRFGKSLLISTLAEAFSGNKDLFEGLFIYDKIEWTQYPIVRLDFGGMSHHTSEALANSLYDIVKDTADRFQIILESVETPDRFGELIEKLHQSSGKQVVVLIDEYDKPIIDRLSTLEIAEANRNLLHDFYQVIKSVDEHLRFVFLTGVSKFSKTSIFSGLNNLSDISLDGRYAAICGYTQEELESSFDEYIRQVATGLSTSKEQVLEDIRLWYNGYTWNGQTPVYNPFSTLLFLDRQQLNNYWFETGTPTFLVQLIKERNDVEPIVESIIVDSSALGGGYEPGQMSIIPLLFQTGYLTIKSVCYIPGELPEYTLGIPNREVNDSLLANLFGGYTNYPVDLAPTLRKRMQHQLRAGDTTALEKSLREMLAHIPYPLHLKHEAYYHSLLLLWLRMLGFEIRGEVMTNIGRIDAVWTLPNQVIVAEIKCQSKKEDISALLDEAMAQIRERRYYEQFARSRVSLLAVAFAGTEIGCRMEEKINQNRNEQ